MKILLKLVFNRQKDKNLEKPLLSVRNLCISLFAENKEKKKLVNGISFDVHQGEVVGIVGESGSGKSLTCLSIPGLLNKNIRVVKGEIIFEDQNLLLLDEKNLRPYRGSKIAMVFQEPMSSFNPVMTCGEQINEILNIHTNLNKEQLKEKTLSLFNKVQLHDPQRAYKSYPHELSGGQLQRIMIAMAISCNPDLLIADECTTALDVTVQKEILILLKQLNKELDISIIFISHDLGVIKDIADRTIVMKNGEIVEQDKTSAIFKSPKENYTKILLASVPPSNIALKKLPKPELFYDDKNFSDEKVKKFYLDNTLSANAIEQRKKEILESNTILRISNLSKQYVTSTNFWGKPKKILLAVDDISFELKNSETLGIVGESGSGKSTISKAILQLIKSESGEVEFFGKKLHSMSNSELRKIRKDIQYIFQDPYSSLNPRLTVGFAIQEPMKVHNIRPSKKERKEYAISLLEKVGLDPEHYDRYPHEFSGGQRQRICIARALALEPKVLVCDEIVSALDVSVQAQVLNLLVDLRDEYDLSLIFVTHDLSIVRFLCERTLVMKKGTKVEYGWTDEIFNSPQTEYTKKLLDSVPGKSLAI